MTPKEKAEELVNKFRQQTDGIAGYNYDNVNKQCALIAVDEIINSRPAITDSQIQYKNYWQEVKTEIEKI